MGLLDRAWLFPEKLFRFFGLRTLGSLSFWGSQKNGSDSPFNFLFKSL
jgi:hypothetical protein